MPRLSKIYTRTGDDGTTGLADGTRVRKDEPRIEAIGDVDELNSAVGLLRAHIDSGDDIDAMLESIQHRLFDLGGELAMPGHAFAEDAWSERLEGWLDGLNADLPPLQDFVLPGGNLPATHAHLARSICRRAERSLLRLSDTETVNSAALKYLNRLSDLLFVIARVLARRGGGNEVNWRKGIE
jgi:cob(I)alamin adenosyltransferase